MHDVDAAFIMVNDESQIIAYTFTGQDEYIPPDATHVSIHESVKFVPMLAFYKHPNLVELICHKGVKRIEEFAVARCPSLRRVVMLGVEVIERFAFINCEVLTHVECEKLERIGRNAFYSCISLIHMNLLSVRVVKTAAFFNCQSMTSVSFGSNLEYFDGGGTFCRCYSLERVTLPLKNGMIPFSNSAFKACVKLKQVDLVEETIPRDTIAALLMEDWSNDLNETIGSIKRILSRTNPGDDFFNIGRKAIAIRGWIARIVRKIIHYEAEHQRLLNETSATLLHVLPADIVINGILPFLEFPPHSSDEEFHIKEVSDY